MTRVQALQASALTVQDAGVREGVRYGALSLLGMELRVDAGMLADDEIWGEERRIVNATAELLAAALRGDVKQLEVGGVPHRSCPSDG